MRHRFSRGARALAVAAVVATTAAIGAEDPVADRLAKLPPVIDRDVFFGDPEISGPERHGAFQAIVLGGMLRGEGMPGFADVLTPEDPELVRQYVISQALAGREAQNQAAGSGSPAG